MFILFFGFLLTVIVLFLARRWIIDAIYSRITPDKRYDYTRGCLVWTVIVLLNSILCYFFALSAHNNVVQQIAILAGVVSFIALYTFLDAQLIKHQHFRLATLLWACALIKALTQFSIFPDFYAGALASVAVSNILPQEGFFQTYLITLLTGFILSIVVSILIAFVRLIIFIQHKYSHTHN